MLVAAPVAPCCPSSSLFALLDVFPMIISGLRYFTQEPYSESAGQVRLSGCPAVRVGAFQCSPVVVGDARESENVMQCPNTTHHPASDDYSFWEHRRGIQ